MPTEDDARRIALSLPETSERPSYGTPGFRVQNKLFARIHEMPDTLVVWVPDMGEKEAMLATSPHIYFETPHYDGYPMLLVRLKEIGLDELTEVITESWRARAPRRLLPLLDAVAPAPTRRTGSRKPPSPGGRGGRFRHAALRERSGSSLRSMMWSTRP